MQKFSNDNPVIGKHTENVAGELQQTCYEIIQAMEISTVAQYEGLEEIGNVDETAQYALEHATAELGTESEQSEENTMQQYSGLLEGEISNIQSGLSGNKLQAVIRL